MSSTCTFFSGRVVLVSGGGGGIGRCVSQALASEGARVMVADINLEAAQATVQCLPGDALHQAIKVDVGSSGSVKALFEVIEETCQQPATIVVNCAAIPAVLRPLVSMDEEHLDDVMRINLKGTFLVTQAAARAMIAGKVNNCAIVNMASMVAKEICPNMSVYSAAKAGVVALTRVAATELAVHGIRVNAVLPEVVDTPMIAHEFSTEEIAGIVANQPLGRLCRPEEVAETVKFLCGPGSSCTSGVAVDVTYCFYKNSGRK
ncbi:estradiol 17-beta-dehydrogenase 8 [Ixodes scapularis]